MSISNKQGTTERFLATFGRLAEPFLLIDASTGNVLAANPFCAELLGRARRDLEQAPLSSLVREDPSDVERLLRIWGRSGDFIPGALTWRMPDGHHAPSRCEGAIASPGGGDFPPESVLLRIVPRAEGNNRFFTLNEKLNDLAQENAERRRAERLLAAQNEVLELVAGDRPLRDVLDKLTRVIEEYTGPELLASILLLDKDGVHLRHGAAPSLPEEYNRAIDGVAIGPAVGSCGTAAYTGQPVVVSDIATDPLWENFRAAALPHGLRACWSSPIVGASGEVLGTFAMYHRQPRKPREREWKLVSFVTRTAAIAIERSRSAEQLQRVMAEQASILDALPAALALLDAEGRIVAVNTCWRRSVAQRLGANAGIGQAYLAACAPHWGLPENTGREIAERFEQVLSGKGATFTLEYESTLQPGIWWHLTVATLSDRETERRGAVVRHLDISDRKSAEIELLRRSEALAKANAELQQFAYVASHDLREPLRTIKGFTQLLDRRYGSGLSAEAREYLEFIASGVDRMDSLLGDLLAYSRATHATDSEHKTGSLVRACETALRNLQGLMEEAKAAVDVDDLPDAVFNEVQITQVFQNLIANAIKYTYAEGRRPHIRVSAGEDDDFVTVAVGDNGPGVPPEYREMIFGMFKRLHAREVPGSGLGLALSRKIVESHGGRIWADAAAGGGSVFRFTVPKHTAR